MRKHTGIPIVILMLVLAVACAQGDGAAGSAAVLIIHEVADYGVWKSVFDDHIQARKDASCQGHYLKRGIDEPDMVYVSCLGSNPTKLRRFLDGSDLADAMKLAGVKGTPTIILLKPMSRDLVLEKMLPGIIVMHQVEDYDTWRAAYDGFDEFRRQNGIVGHAVSQVQDKPNQVIAYHQANDVAALRAFVESAELKETMQRAGVVGEPDIRFIEIVDFADY